MVFLTLVTMMPRMSGRGVYNKINRGPDKFWRIQQTLRMAWRFRNRARNCFTISVRYVNRAMRNATRGRKLKKKAMRSLWAERLEAAASEHGLTYELLMEGLAQSNVSLDRKVLTDLAIYEPRTFQSLCEVAKKKTEMGLASLEPVTPPGVITRGML